MKNYWLDFKVGDVVAFRNNAQKMTVAAMNAYYLQCVWFENTRLHGQWISKQDVVKL